MSKFVKMDVKYYVVTSLQSGKLEPICAVKTGKVLARRGKLGEEVITYTDKGLIEKKNKVSVDKNTGSVDMVLMKANDYGYPIIDEYGHVNEWIVKEKDFVEEYVPDKEIDGVFQSTDGLQLFVPVLIDMVFMQNGKDMFVGSGGYLNITDITDIYGISKRDFEDTYHVIDNLVVSKRI